VSARRLPAIAGAALLTLAGCNQPAGDFDGVQWAPMTMQFAVADRHQITESRGSLVATQRPDAAKSLTILLSGALANPHFEWRRSTSDTLLTLRQDLATTDGLLLYDIPLSALDAGAELSRHENTGEADEPRDFEAAIVVQGDVVTASEDRGFGNDLEITLSIDDIDPNAFGFVRGSLELKRGRGEEQSGDVATGSVSVPLNLPVVAERRGKANLAIAAPIMRCAAEKGPARAATCVDAPPDDVPEASDGIAGF
jgi:hypothetical protein